MDWSLALASQELSCVIQPPTAAAGWRLEVSSIDAGRAFKTLRLYHVENRRGKMPIPMAGLAFHWGALLWCLLVLIIYASEQSRGGLTEAAMVSSTGVHAGEWWRLFT